MSTKELLIQQIENLAETELQKILDYISLIKSSKIKDEIESYKLSESSLSKDWLREEEDEAWKNL